MDIEEFYAADERRRASEEVEFGRDWLDEHGNRYELSWVRDTGELYTMLEPAGDAAVFTPFGDFDLPSMESADVPTGTLLVAVIAVEPSEERITSILDGWPDEMGRPGGITWAAQRLLDAGVAVRRPEGSGGQD